eukprot:361520-Chlamydomonas_euryale.AAC.2
MAPARTTTRPCHRRTLATTTWRCVRRMGRNGVDGWRGSVDGVDGDVAPSCRKGKGQRGRGGEERPGFIRILRKG